MNILQEGLKNNKEEDNIDLKGIFDKILDKWIWFVFSLIAGILIAFFYIKFTPPLYQVTAKVLVNDNGKGGGVAKQAGALMDFGGLIAGSNSVDNEAEILKTRFLMEQVVRQMQLNIVYSKKDSWVRSEIYESPLKLTIIKAIDTIRPTSLRIEGYSKNKIKVICKDFEAEVNFNQTFKVPNIGLIMLSIDPALQSLPKGEFTIDVSSIDQRVAALMGQLNVGVSNKQATIIDLGLSYSVPKKGEDILNSIINRYIKSNLEDKNIIADSTTKFIQNRLSIIARELGDVENKVQSFKQGNKLADMSEQGKLLVQNSGEFTTELAKAETQVTVLNDLENYLKDETKNKRVFPSSLLPSDMVFSGLMNQYNALLIERDKQLLSVTEESPFIQNIDNQIAGLRRGILANIQSTKNSFVVTRNKLRAQVNQNINQIAGVPQIEKDYLKLARNQQIKQELYIFLMQKAEETAISKTSNISIAKTIDPPKAQVAPISPKKNIIYLAGVLIGLIIPTCFVFVADLFNTAISAKEDISNNTVVPIIGEISHNIEGDNLIVANKGRSAISEQFRALRTNLSFYLKNIDEKVILLTSSMSGEGKSFTAINLGNILALAGKRVLLMELDLRKPGLSAKLGVSNDVGFSNYTIDASLKAENIIKPLSINKNMFIISSGPLPPNPAETLMSGRVPQLVSDLKDQFDYIIMDAPPIGIIADAQLLSVYADVTLYLVRQKVTQKNQLTIVEELYRSGKMKNLGIIVNDIFSKYYGYGYGYGNYGQEKDESIINNIKNTFKKRG
jgi:tyrosine-protein kinase Etk/Wzc